MCNQGTRIPAKTRMNSYNNNAFQSESGPPAPIMLPTIYRALRRNDDYQDYEEPMYRCEDRTNYDELSHELWSDYFYDRRMQNVRESNNDYDYGFSEGFVNNSCGGVNRRSGSRPNNNNHKSIQHPRVRIESKNNILHEASLMSKNFSAQNPQAHNWPLDSKNIF